MSTHQDSFEKQKPHILIVGAGLAGLLLAHLLDKQGVSYEIFERSGSVKPLGKGVAITQNVVTPPKNTGYSQTI